jgi:biopolymer transport protein ExbD
VVSDHAKKKEFFYCRIDVWGFASVMVVLLFVLMVSGTTYHDMPGNSVDLALSHHATSMPRVLREDAMRIYIRRDGKVYFGDVHILRKDLPTFVREGLRNSAEKKVYVSVDARAKYGDVLDNLDEVRLAGVEKVSFLSENSQR